MTGYTNGGVVVFADSITRNKSNCESDPTFQNAVKCQNTNNWIRFSFSGLNPYALLTNVTNQAGQMVSIPYLINRLTHTYGFMIALEANQEYSFVFNQARYPSTVSYSGVFYGVALNDYVIIKHEMSRRPDKITISGYTMNEYKVCNIERQSN